MTARLRDLFFTLTFGLTGVAIAMLGATLPAVLHEWRLSDGRGGLLLLCAWAGSTSGAFFARGRSGKSAIAGLALASLGLYALTLPRLSSPPPLYALYGLGLGITMTSISLMRARQATAPKADIALNRLNLVWAIGAFFSPALALHSLRLLSVLSLFRVFAAVLATASLLALLLSVLRVPNRNTPQPTMPGLQPPMVWAPLRFCLFAAAAVGLESAVGSWLTTYAERSIHGLATAVSANSAFWAGLLLSRAAHSLPSAGLLHTLRARAAHIAVASVGILLLILVPSRGLLPVAGLLCGLGLGPLYPFILSVAIPRFRSTAVFATAGIGASVVPWLTGALSSASGSLRVGLLAPAATSLLLIAVAAHMRTELR